ncbi:ribosome maturation factor RimM [Chelativorans sp. SCAU2101]|jgi:16S rRNA processing protein RimM|uniref:Ribosome maturation factor RimM n=1 Tax=Chelativorans petroleitrophicus TaxID=2975484 RepID=A0A9X3B579_9HYPH|nr:ribosome maturation factor RimM [Chelativorans petroleitrophicus]MCT8988718.1 ribosome maturation factor RimM [Chelativorans petroleitrophicus]
MAKPGKPVQLGIIGAPFGVRGELRVKTFTEDPLALGSYGPLTTGSGRVLEVAGIRPAKGVAIVRFKGVGDRNTAEVLRGEALFVDRAALPEALEEEEYYHADLIGLQVVDESGKEVGRIVAIHNFGAGDVLEVQPGTGSTVMISFTRDAVPRVDVKEGTVGIDRAAAGLDGTAEREAPQRSRRARPARKMKSAGGAS